MNKVKKFIKEIRNYGYRNKIIKEGENLTVEGDLFLNGTQIKELPENLTVGGDLYLRETQIKELPENLTVEGDLFLSETQIKELPENLTVGGGLYLSGTQIKDCSKVKHLQEGYNKEHRYIYFDGILWGNVKSVKVRDNITIYKTPLGYCVTEEKLYAHGKTLKGAMEDLIYKKTENKEIEEIVAEIKRTNKVTREQYRVITGACQYGTNKFCEEHNIQDLKEISLEELRKILINDYGAERFWDLIDKEV